MLIERTELRKAAKAGAVFLFIFLVGFPISYMRIFAFRHSPHSLFLVFFDNQIWFYPQTVLPPGFQFVDAQGVCHGGVSPPIAMLLSLFFWAAVGAGFAWFTRNLRLRFTAPLAVLTIVFAPWVVYLLLHIFTIEPEVIGP